MIIYCNYQFGIQPEVYAYGLYFTKKIVCKTCTAPLTTAKVCSKVNPVDMRWTDRSSYSPLIWASNDQIRYCKSKLKYFKNTGNKSKQEGHDVPFLSSDSKYHKKEVTSDPPALPPCTQNYMYISWENNFNKLSVGQLKVQHTKYMRSRAQTSWREDFHSF